jgi:hypothetical protein
VNTTHNPLLGLRAIAALQALPADQRAAIRGLLLELSTDAATRAETSWRKHKAPMATYWKAVGVYAKHTARAINQGGRR